MPVDKTWTLNCLRHNRNSALLGLASLNLLNDHRALELLAGRMIVITPDAVIFNAMPEDQQGQRFDLALDQIVQEHEFHRERYMHTLGEYLRWQRRNLLKESFEVVKAYANEVGSRDQFRALPCHTYARILRNCVSHDLHFHFPKDVLAALPVEYGGVRIDASLQGRPMLDSHLPPFVAWQLHTELESFVQAN